MVIKTICLQHQESMKMMWSNFKTRSHVHNRHHNMMSKQRELLHITIQLKHIFFTFIIWLMPLSKAT